MDKLVDLDKHEPDSLDVYVNRLSPDQLKSSQAAAVRTRFLELGSIIASQAATISDLEHRLKDVESLAHSHPKSTVAQRVLTEQDLRLITGILEDQRTRLDGLEGSAEIKIEMPREVELLASIDSTLKRMDRRGQTKKRKR